MGQCLSKFDNDTTPAAHPGEKLSSGVYSFQTPEVEPEVEIVFIHGVQLSGDSKDAYWRTWMARDGSGDCWPKTWLGTRFPSARILSLSYDANAVQTPTTGRMDLYSLGESLVQQMVFQGVEIGQSGCPVVFVCHSFGGIVAKQLVVSARDRLASEGGDIDRLLKNVKGFFFYATPHKGSEMASLFGHIPLLAASPLMEYLKIMSTDNARLCSDFKRCEGESAWKFQVVAESHATHYKSTGLFHGVVVDEASSRHEGYDFIKVEADHFDVCKPASMVDTSYQCLTGFVSSVVEEHRRKLFASLELPSKVVGMVDKVHELKEKMKTNAIVGLVGVGGIGKTTLSKALYNEERQSFDKACFLENVASGDTGKLWERVKNDLGCDEWNFEDYILKKKVLLVVDDILGSSEIMLNLKVLAFKKATNGSKVIVTCRNRAVLMPDYVQPGGLVDVETLNEEQAIELFSHYWFESSKTLEGLFYGHSYIGLQKEKEECGPSFVQSSSGDRFEKLRLLILRSAQLPVVEYYLGLSSHKLTWLCLEERRIKGINIDMLGSFKELRVLEMSWCAELEELPASIGDLSHLMELRLSSTALKCLPGTIGKLEKLEVLLVQNCRQLAVLSASLGQLKYLRVLDLSYCLWLKVVPPGVGELPKLRYLSLDCCDQLEKLYKFDSVMGQLQKLSLEQCRCLENIEGLGNLLGLTELRLSGSCDGLMKAIVETLLQDCLRFDYLVSLVLPVFPEMELPHQIWPRLRTLRLENGLHLSELPNVLGNLTFLVDLQMEDDFKHFGVKEIPGSYLCKLKGLKALYLCNFRELEEVPEFVGNLLSLVSLHLSGCRKLVTLPQSLGSLYRLKELRLDRCSMLERLSDGVGQLPTLDLGGCSKLLWCKEKGQFDILRQLDDRDCAISLPNGSFFGELGQSWEELREEEGEEDYEDEGFEFAVDFDDSD